MLSLNRDHMLSLNREFLVKGLTRKLLVTGRNRQERPRSAPRAAQEATKRDQKGMPISLPLSGGLREASGTHFISDLGAIWGPPGKHFGAIFGRIFEPILVAFSRLWSSCFSLLLAPFASVLGPESPERSRRNARETSHLASEAALGAEQWAPRPARPRSG